jgi:hypothetical protein
VPDNRRVVDRELIEEPDDPLGVTANRHIPPGRTVAPPVAKQVDHDDTMPLRNERNYIGPKVRRRWKSVKKNDGLAGSTTSGGVVVEARSVYVDELTPHERSRRRYPGDIDGMSALPGRSGSRGKMFLTTSYHKRKC